MRFKIIGSVAGRSRGTSGWQVLLTLERKRFFYKFSREFIFTKLDSERHWEDENGWYLLSSDPLARACDEAVEAVTPWRVDTSAGEPNAVSR